MRFADLPAEIRNIFFHGTKRRLTFRQGTYRYESDWKGALRTMRDRMEDPPSEKTRAALDELIAPVPCPVCEGARLQPESLAVKVNGLGIADYTTLPIEDSVKRIDDSTGESTFKKAGKVTATNTRKLSADGKTLTVTSKGVTEDGKPRADVQVFEK